MNDPIAANSFMSPAPMTFNTYKTINITIGSTIPAMLLIIPSAPFAIRLYVSPQMQPQPVSLFGMQKVFMSYITASPDKTARNANTIFITPHFRSCSKIKIGNKYEYSIEN